MSPRAFSPSVPYDQIPLLPPGVELETRAVLKACVAARAAVAELKSAADAIPNPAMLISTLPLLEARASSEIENIVTTADLLFAHLEAEAGADPATKEALRYRHALLEAFHALAKVPLGTRVAEQVCSRIKGVDMSVRRVPGTVLANSRTGETIYTPPQGEALLRNLLANWERFVHDESPLDPLVRMAVAHYQFEAIHPFTDGNGRTGRILNSLQLVEYELLALPILYLSRFIIANKDDYYRLLNEVTRSAAWEPWLLFVLRGVEETARFTNEKIGAIRRLHDETTDFARRQLPRIYTRELVDVLFEQPYCRIANLVRRGIARRQTASSYLKALAAAGVLEERAAGREKVFLNPRLLRILTAETSDYRPFATSS